MAYSEEINKRACEWAKALCSYAGETEEFADGFWKELQENEDLYEEFVYYMEHQNFLCKMNVMGITITDVLIFGVDRFKAGLDDFEKRDQKYNPDKLLLAAFVTMLKVKKAPEKYAEVFRSMTGTDYPDKIAPY